MVFVSSLQHDQINLKTENIVACLLPTASVWYTDRIRSENLPSCHSICKYQV